MERALEKLNRQSWTVEVHVNASSRDGQKEVKFQEKIDAAIYEGYPKPEENEIDQTIAAQVKIIEDVCLPVLRLESEKRKGKSSNCGLVHG